MKKLIRHIAVSLLLTSIVVLAFASKGGGGDKKNASPFKNDFTPISANGFTLKNGYTYAGSHFFNQEKSSDNKSLCFNAMISYQQGNSIFIMPYNYKVNASIFNNNTNSSLQFLGVKINMGK
ncbi:MAG TPA: hypothetical protein VMI35_12760 [Puia sp.]|nr:hypothetical protein [Puia sp.]